MYIIPLRLAEEGTNHVWREQIHTSKDLQAFRYGQREILLS